ncbi:putative conserved hypothetical protein [Serratia symbiotica str. Tucson]|uniref:Cell envelope biogenesis protein TolA n=2 Tax=Serratia symbiotica TaxID=138074 RepID=E9CLV7_9GAMM|nr:hypothetical protein [Serratia symbiotica]EFW12619.1 putative conserved hypothetical protein [Serratia symbiotica str. Tucson]BBI91638.1 uncharacterized protein SSYIS1_09110 [Serratia symbiotica]BBI92197.1 uncharacterized protein SSYIS1_18120 [Serratia symbiotica]
MNNEKSEVALANLPSVPAELELAFIDDAFIDGLIENIRDKASAVVGDINTAKGRKVYISMAANVRSTKVMIDDAGKNLVAEMKKRPALVDASRRKVREALDELAVEIRKPVTEWEAEQARIKAVQLMQAWHTEALEMNDAFDKALAERIESDHEIALLMNEKRDREIAEAKAEAERKRIAHEEELNHQAAIQARRQAEAEIAAAKREAEAKAALERAERDKQEAIEAEKQRAKAEADQKAAARLAEEKRIADEAAKRAADVEHRKTVNQTALGALIKAGIPENYAKLCIRTIALGNVPAIHINY